ncbi:MAG: DUF3185 family protein [Chlamydiales bacterium]|nr:DUF3185 family protein [Chlamydiales bacterium]
MNVIIALRIFGLIVFCIGSLLLTVGIISSQAYLEWISQKLTGRYTEETMGYLLGGASAIVTGIVVLFFSIFTRK